MKHNFYYQKVIAMNPNLYAASHIVQHKLSGEFLKTPANSPMETIIWMLGQKLTMTMDNEYIYFRKMALHERRDPLGISDRTVEKSFDAYKRIEQIQEQISQAMGIPSDMLKPAPAPTNAPASWILPTASCKAMLDEVKRRPHGKWKEIDHYNHPDKKSCRCDDCYSQRQRLVTELENIVCENR